MKLSQIFQAKSEACGAIENFIENLESCIEDYNETIRSLSEDEYRKSDVKYYERYIKEAELKIEYYKKALKAIKNA